VLVDCVDLDVVVVLREALERLVVADATFLTCDELSDDAVRLAELLLVVCTERSVVDEAGREVAEEREVELATVLSAERLDAVDANAASREVRATLRSVAEPLRFLSHPPPFEILPLGANLSTRLFIIVRLST